MKLKDKVLIAIILAVVACVICAIINVASALLDKLPMPWNWITNSILFFGLLVFGIYNLMDFLTDKKNSDDTDPD